MDHRWNKRGGPGGGRDSHRQRLHSSNSSASLGYIFDNPVAYEESSSDSRRKIDYGNNVENPHPHHLRIKTSPRSCPRSSPGSSPSSMGGLLRHHRRREPEPEEEEKDYDPSKTVISQPSRRRLCLDDLATTPTDVLLLASAASSDSTSSGTTSATTPLLEDCEIYSDISGERIPSLRSSLTRGGCSTPVRDPSGSGSEEESSVSMRSLEDLGEKTTPDRRFSREGSLRNGYFVYPGWSMWNREHSYRSLNRECSDDPASSKGFLGVKSLRTTLYQHLLAAAGQRYNLSTVNLSSSRRCTCGRGGGGGGAAGEESKLPLLLKSQRSVKKKMKAKRRASWEPMTILRKGLRSLASRGFPHDGFMGIAREQLERRMRIKNPNPGELDVTSRERGSGFLQCMIRNGDMSYSLWMDGDNPDDPDTEEEEEEVLVAKPEPAERCIRFYKCRAERSRWRRRKSLVRRRIVSLVGSMNFSCYVYSEVSFKGGGTGGRVTHYMDSEFSLLGFHSLGSDSDRKKQGSWLTRRGSPRSIEGGVKMKKELSAVVIRAPLEVRKDDLETRSGSVVSLVEGVKRRSSWGSVLGSTGESVHVILPRGDHGHPTCGMEGPRPLAERWRSGGLCDCGSWDLGCGMITLSREDSWKDEENAPLNITLEGTKERVVAMSLNPCEEEEGLYRVRFEKPMMALQAFATAVAVLHGKLNSGEFNRCVRSDENQTKLPVVFTGSRHPNPPLSPIDRL